MIVFALIESMQEIFLQYLWNHRLFRSSELKTSDGTPLQIIFPGIWNQNSGPDFFNARLKLGEQTWAGNVEIHYRSSDWYRHGHQNDPAYQNIILHVVVIDDREVLNDQEIAIPCLRIEDEYNLYPYYRDLIEKNHWVACEPYLPRLAKNADHTWLTRLGVDRLEEKSNKIKDWLQSSRNNWEECFYHLLASSFGQKVNSIPFEMMARSVPLNLVHSIRDKPFSLYALFIGQAGFLSNPLFQDNYHNSLSKEYEFLKNKFRLTEIPTHLWKMMRLRPKNFPVLRIVQFVAFLQTLTSLMNWLLESNSIDDYRGSFDQQLPEYWNIHFVFGKESPPSDKRIGEQAIDGVLLNAVAPMLFVYGEYQDRPDLKEKAVDLMEKIRPEKNADLLRWIKLGISPTSAFETQALLHLKRKYCDMHQCLFCRWGDQIIRFNSSESKQLCV